MLGRSAGVLAAGAAAVLLLPLLIIMLLLGSAGSGTAASAAGSAQDAAVMTGPLPPGAAGTAIAFAQAQLGKPYLFGGTGPDAFDCSGLVMMAYQSAGVTIPRTSEVQYAQLPHVSPADVKPGDLVFFAGGDGTRHLARACGARSGPGAAADDRRLRDRSADQVRHVRTGSHTRVRAKPGCRIRPALI